MPATARRIVIALVSISVAVVCSLSGEAQADGGTVPTGCVALGLKPIPAKVSLFMAGDSAIHAPTLKVVWSGKPLPARCHAHTVLAVRARVPFPKTGHTLEFAPPEYPSRWKIFWLGRTHVHDAEQLYSGPAVTFNVGCVEDPKAWLRYQVVGHGGRSLGELVRPVSLHSEICERASKKPTVRAAHAYGIDDWSAVMRGSINPNGLETSWRFQLGTTKAYGLPLVDASAEKPLGGSRRIAVEEAVNCLAPSTTYHFRIVARNKAGRTYGPDQTFTTKRQAASETGIYERCPGHKPLG